MTRVAIIADDLTGALDTASPFACRGAQTLCFTEPHAIHLEDALRADVISVSTNSRHMSAARATAVVTAAAETIKKLAPDIILKKVDSRLKGRVALESDAVATVFGRGELLIVPAAPDVGRHVVEGFVQGAGVSQPIEVSPLFADSNRAISIPDAASHAALLDVASSFMSASNVLPVCARGFAVALAQCLLPRGAVKTPDLKAPWLVAIGSRDTVTAKQRSTLCSASDFPCHEAADGRVNLDFPPWKAVLLYCSGAETEEPNVVASRFAGGVCAAIHAGHPGTVLCSGGDTAHAVLRSLNKSCLQVLGEVAPGLPLSRFATDGQDLVFISKSGGFGTSSTLLNLFANQPGYSPKELDHHGSRH